MCIRDSLNTGLPASKLMGRNLPGCVARSPSTAHIPLVTGSRSRERRIIRFLGTFGKMAARIPNPECRIPKELRMSKFDVGSLMFGWELGLTLNTMDLTTLLSPSPRPSPLGRGRIAAGFGNRRRPCLGRVVANSRLEFIIRLELLLRLIGAIPLRKARSICATRD